MITYIIPTRDRQATLDDTLRRLGSLPPHPAEVIVIDNASASHAECSARLHNGLPVTVLRLERNLGAAARNHGARAAHSSSRWLIMLDDDSCPLDTAFLAELQRLAPGVAAASADITLSDGRREQGGLPEVFVGCGVAIRTEVFTRLGGYDETFGYYAEEYDLAARMILDGHRIQFVPSFRVEHRKCTIGREFTRIARNLVRNNCRVAARYAPDARRWNEFREHLIRYANIARKERALLGYARGVLDLLLHHDSKQRTAMSEAQWARFTGADACRGHLAEVFANARPRRIAVVDEGKNVGVLREILRELQAPFCYDLTNSREHADLLVIGTLSPGPMLDAMERRDRPQDIRMVMPWCPMSVAVSACQAA